MPRSEYSTKLSDGNSRNIAGAQVMRAVLILFAMSLTACAAQPDKSRAVLSQPNKPNQNVVQQKAPAAPVATPVAVLTSTRPPSIWQSADKLIGLSGDELQAALGKPARIRGEVDSHIYQYVGRDCVLDLFLYPATSGDYRVSYAEARSVQAEKKSADACLKSLSAPVVANNTSTN